MSHLPDVTWPQKGDVIISGYRYEVHKVEGGRVYFFVEEPDWGANLGYGSSTLEGWADLKARAS